MKISIERAIEILDPEHREHYESIDPVNEACRMGMEALKNPLLAFIKQEIPFRLEEVWRCRRIAEPLNSSRSA